MPYETKAPCPKNFRNNLLCITGSLKNYVSVHVDCNRSSYNSRHTQHQRTEKLRTVMDCNSNMRITRPISIQLNYFTAHNSCLKIRDASLQGKKIPGSAADPVNGYRISLNFSGGVLLIVSGLYSPAFLSS